jgi:membrane associated rhomboid family serine protease
MQTWLGFSQRDLGLHRYWTALTYMFVHAGLLHLAVNMYTLWIFGPRVEHLWGSRSFSWFYIWCGVGGAVFHLMFNQSGLLMGASAAVLGVSVAYASHWPDDEIYLFAIVPMKVKWFMWFNAAFNILMGALAGASSNSGVQIAYLAHVGGMVFAWIYMRTPNAQSLDRFRQRVTQAPDTTDEPPRAVPRVLPRQRDREPEVDDVVAKSKAVIAKQRPAPLPITPRAVATPPSATELDGVLDKISQHGLESLTPDERRILEEMSKRLRQG